MSGHTIRRAGTLAGAAAATAAGLAEHAPHLLASYSDALPGAADTVGRRLRGALVREDLADARARHAGQGRRHAFDRVEFATAGVDDPADLLPESLRGGGFAAELGNAVVNLAVAVARQRSAAPPARRDPDPDTAAVRAELLAVAGHNLHPCGRTRLGWQLPDVLAHDLESGVTRIGFVAVRRDAHLGDDLGAVLADAYPDLPAAPPGYLRQPVHAWQRDTVLPRRYPHLLRDGTLRILDDEIAAVPTAAVRTLLLPVGADGRRHYLKLSLDIQVTSARRSISVASTRNGPAVSALLHRLLADDPDGHRLLLLAETAGAAVPAGSGRDVSAIWRTGLTGRLHPGEQVLPGGALPAVDPATGRTVLAGLVAGYALSTGRADDAGTARAFLDAYARLLLPPLLRLTARGVALEAHLQNCLPTFVGGVPHRLGVRDFAGLRLHLPRLAAGLPGRQWTGPLSTGPLSTGPLSTGPLSTGPLWPGSVIGTADDDVFRAKIGYTALQAHLGELIIRLGESHDLDEDTAWATVRATLDDTYAELAAGPVTAGPVATGSVTATVVAAARADHAALTAPTVPHKALVRMRLGDDGDVYLPVRNPLHVPR